MWIKLPGKRLNLTKHALTICMINYLKLKCVNKFNMILTFNEISLMIRRRSYTSNIFDIKFTEKWTCVSTVYLKTFIYD